jgi:hypothetical protein
MDFIRLKNFIFHFGTKIIFKLLFQGILLKKYNHVWQKYIISGENIIR